jgi:hypothetical protein
MNYQEDFFLPFSHQLKQEKLSIDHENLHLGRLDFIDKILKQKDLRIQ